MARLKNRARLEGWTAICRFVGLSRPTLIKYGFPVYQLSRGSRVFAYAADLRRHKTTLEQRLFLLPPQSFSVSETEPTAGPRQVPGPVQRLPG